MPFTLSHPAAVLPLRRTGLPLAALVCGSMAPDLHMAVPGVSDAETHAWTGVPTLDVLLGAGLTVLWVLLLEPTARAAAPRWVRDRLRPAPGYGARQWLLSLVGVLVGAVTHVGWDTFTHQAMWGGQHIPWLYEIHHGRPGYAWAQYLSSVVGLAVVAAYVARVLSRREPHETAPSARAYSARLALLAPFAAACLLALAVSLVMLAQSWLGLGFVLASALRVVLVVTSLGAACGALLWRLGDRFELAG